MDKKSKKDEEMDVGTVHVNPVVLSEELKRFLGSVAGYRIGLTTLYMPVRQPINPGEEKTDKRDQTAFSLQKIRPSVYSMMSKIGTGLGEALDHIAYELNLVPVEDLDAFGGELTDTMTGNQVLEEERQRQEREESAAMGLNHVGGLCVLTQLRKVRESIDMATHDLHHLETLDFSRIKENEQQFKLHREAILWCLSLLRQGIKLEKQLEMRIVDDQIGAVRITQAAMDPCSHRYLKSLLEIENLERRKTTLHRIRIQEERNLITHETTFVQDMLADLKPGTPSYRELSAHLYQLREAFDLLEGLSP